MQTLLQYKHCTKTFFFPEERREFFEELEFVTEEIKNETGSDS